MTKLTTVRKSTQTLPMARLGPPSTMPRFRWQQPTPNRATPPNFGLTRGGERHGFNWGEDSILPYQVSDDYDREQRPAELEVLVIENERLRAVIAPSLGGRLLELKDLASGRDLVFRNPVFQPANLAALNAWFSGGIEWNGLIPGHTPFTCAPVFAGVRETAAGADPPDLRVRPHRRGDMADRSLPAGGLGPAVRARAHRQSVVRAAPRLLVDQHRGADERRHAGAEPGRVLDRAHLAGQQSRPLRLSAGRTGTRPIRTTGRTRPRCSSARHRPRGSSSPRSIARALASCRRARARWRAESSSISAASRRAELDGLPRAAGRGKIPRDPERHRTDAEPAVSCSRRVRSWTGPRHLRRSSSMRPRRTIPTIGRRCRTRRQSLDGAVPAEELARVDAFLREQSRLPLDIRYSAGQPWGDRGRSSCWAGSSRQGLDFGVDAPGDCWDDLARGLAISEANLRDVPDGIAVSNALDGPRRCERRGAGRRRGSTR